MARSRELKIVVAGDVDQLTKSLKKGGDEVDRFGKRTRLTASVTSKGFHGMRLAATGAVGAVGGLTFALKGAVDAASDINESLTKNQALFGKNAKVIEDYAKTTAKSLGISRREALSAAGTFGGLFDAIDIGEKKSATMSKRLVTLAADLASFNNASPEEALEALRSGLAGEAEPMRKFNAFLSETRVKAEAARLGIGATAVDTGKLKAAQESASIAQDRYNIAVQRFGKDSIEARTAHVSMTNAQERAKKATQGGTAVLTEAEKVQARYSLILKDTKKAQGDFSRTSQGEANQNRILKAQYDDLTSELGGKLLPAKLKVTKALNKFIDEMRTGKGTGGDFVRTLKDIRDEVQPIVEWVGRATKNVARFAAEHPEVTRLAGEVIALGAAIKGLKFVSAATGFTDLLKTGRSVMRSLIRLFARQGAVAGAEAGAAAAGSEGLGSGVVNSLIRKTGGRSGRLFGKAFGAGVVLGLALTAKELTDELYKILGAKKGTATGFGQALLNTITGKGGDGPGKRPAAGKGSTKLMGARPSLAPFAAIGAGYGLSVTSGARPGSITSSGNVSYHSSGEAIDMGDGRGPDQNKMRFFRDLKSRYGSRLAELIYTPGGKGIKNGKPFQYTGQVAADHYDHVHVAIDSGKPGVGDGLGRTQIANLWTRAGGSPARANLATAVALAESGGRTDASNRNSDGSIDRGLWQINSVHGALSTFSPSGNARAAVKISSGGSNWSPWVAYTSGAYRRFMTTGGATPSSGGTQESIQKSLDANQRRIDALRDKLAAVPKGMAGAVQRDRLQAQIQALTSTRRGLTSSARSAPSAQDIRDQREKSGSRLVNTIMAPFAKGIRAATTGAAALGSAIDDQGTAYGQAERRFGQTDEDLGTAAGRTHRIGELAALAKMKRKTLADQRKRAQLLKRAISKTTAELKKLRAARDKQKGAKRAKMSERIAPVVSRLDDLRAELHSLTGEIVDTQLDIGDLAKEAADVAATPDTVPEPGPTVSDRLGEAIGDVDLQERAGLISSADAAAKRTQLRQIALAMPGVTDRERWQILGDLKEATDSQAAAVADNTQAIRDLQDEIAKSNAIAASQVGIELAVAQRAIGDMISGQLGIRATNRAQMPGSGALARL